MGVATREDMLRSVELVIRVIILHGELMRVGSVILAPFLIDDELCKKLIFWVINLEIGKRLLKVKVLVCLLLFCVKVSLHLLGEWLYLLLIKRLTLLFMPIVRAGNFILINPCGDSWNAVLLGDGVDWIFFVLPLFVFTAAGADAMDP